MAPRFGGWQPRLDPSSALALGEEVPGAFPLDLDFQGQPHPQLPRGRQQEALQAGHLRVSISSRGAGRGLRASSAGCLSDTVRHISLPLSLAPLPPLGHFTCKSVLQTAPGFSMTSPGNRKKNRCLSLGVGEEHLPENHLTKTRGPKEVPDQGS